MSDRERAEQRADLAKDEGDSSTEQETPDVEAHRLEQSRVDQGRMENDSEAEDRHRIDQGA